MNRTISTVAVFAMMFLAIGVCIGQTLAARESLGSQLATTLLLIETLAAVGIIGAGVALVRRRYGRSSEVTGSKRLEVVGPLRRLLSAVWSAQSHR